MEQHKKGPVLASLRQVCRATQTDAMDLHALRSPLIEQFLVLPFSHFEALHRHGAKLRFLWCSLMSTDVRNPFHSFTYSYAGLRGSIGPMEDVLDRIMSFLSD